ncbi:hypothetical protein HKX48_006699 [Thoreauomyces humboldtii]|nr:hypothetical protein HKX48_006699 [Thoreauomyces humboldtii]
MLARTTLATGRAIATAAPGRSVALIAPLQSLIGSARTYADHGHGPQKPPMHKEEWLEVARNWPHEYHYPGNYRAGSPDEIFPESDNSGHSVPNPSGAETLSQPETYFNSFWLKTFLTLGGVFALYQANASLTKDGSVHPFTAWLGEREKLFTADRALADHAKWIAIKQREADDRLVVTDGFEQPEYRISFPGTFQRASDHLVDVGSQIDVSDIKIRHRWQKDDDVNPNPYPNKG